MKISIETHADRDYYGIYLNGERQTLCVEADDVAGYVKRYKRDAIGRPTSEIEKVSGKVRIIDERGLLRC